MSSELDSDRAELLELITATRALLQQQRGSGALGLPSAPRAEAPEIRATSEQTTPALVVSAAASSHTERRHLSVPVPSHPKTAPASGGRSLQELEEEVKGCTRCGLCEGRTQTVFARGNGSSRLCFVGEGPGADEDEQGVPFVGKAGQLLDKMIAAMGLSRDEVYVCNIVKCRPPQNRKPTEEEMAACMPYLREQLGLIEPQAIVALGATAVQGLLGVGGGITRLRGNWRLYEGIPLMPTFHPAYLLRTPSAKREVWQDLQEVLRQMGRSLPTKK